MATSTLDYRPPQRETDHGRKQEMIRRIERLSSGDVPDSAELSGGIFLVESGAGLSSDGSSNAGRDHATSSPSRLRRARNAPLEARTNRIIRQSKNAASVVQELNRLKFDSLDLYGRETELLVLHRAYRRLLGQGGGGGGGGGGKNNCHPSTKPKLPTGNHNNSSNKNNRAKARPSKGSVIISMIPKKEPVNMVLVEGMSGMGKSALVKEFKRQIFKSAYTSSTLFASGKFDQLHNPQRAVATPYSAFTTAFEELCGQFSARCKTTGEVNPLREALGNDYRLLVDLIPNLVDELDLESDDVAQVSSSSDDVVRRDSSVVLDGKEFDIVKSQRRFLYAVKTFLRTTCSKLEHPTILFLDDLQSSDQSSLDLLEFILMEPDLHETMFVIGSYRYNEVDADHPLSRRLKSIESGREKSIERIRLSDLSLEHVNQFIADLLNSTLDETRPLAEIAQKKVQGNPFFLIQFLTASRDERYIEYNIGTMRWTWELNSIRKNIVVSNGVLAYLMQRMKSLRDSLRRILLILSCLGSSFEEDVIRILATGLEGFDLLPIGSDESPQELLFQLQGEGLLECFNGNNGRNAFCFAHDQIELAAQSLQGDDTIHLLKLQMAKILYEERDNLDFSGYLFLTVDLWNESREDATHENDDDRKLIELNRMAGSKALDVSAFNAAIHYLRSAIALIPTYVQWNDDSYSLLLELHNSLIKAEFSAGSWEHLNKDIETVLNQKDRPILDKMVAYSVRITVLSSHENKHNEAISLAVEVLNMLGIKFRPSLGKLAFVGGLIKTKKLLRKVPLDSILRHSSMKDKRKQVAVGILTSVTSSMYAVNPELYMTSVLKIFRWSLKYGTTKDTSRCIGLYGLVEMALGNQEVAIDACNIAIRLAEKQGMTNSEYAPTASVHGFVFPWTHPLQNCQKKLYDGYEVGLQTGDMEYAMMNIANYGFFCYSSGKPLCDLEADMRGYAEQMEKCNMMLQLKFLSLTWQAMLNLLGRSDDPFVLTGEAMNQDKALADAERENNIPLKIQLFCYQLQLAVYFSDFELASSLICHTSRIGSVNPAFPMIWRTALFEGVTAFEMARRGIRKYRRIAMKSLEKIKAWVDAGNPNCAHILFLLQAEKLSCDGAIDAARKLYDKSIATAARHGFRSDRALASERCACMYQRIQDEYWANEYFHRAHDEYAEFEAHAKVKQLQKKIPSLRSSLDLSSMVDEHPVKAAADIGEISSHTDLPCSVTVGTETEFTSVSSSFIGLWRDI